MNSKVLDHKVLNRSKLTYYDNKILHNKIERLTNTSNESKIFIKSRYYLKGHIDKTLYMRFKLKKYSFHNYNFIKNNKENYSLNKNNNKRFITLYRFKYTINDVTDFY